MTTRVISTVKAHNCPHCQCRTAVEQYAVCRCNHPESWHLSRSPHLCVDERCDCRDFTFCHWQDFFTDPDVPHVHEPVAAPEEETRR